MKFDARTDRGLVREKNEDSCNVIEGSGNTPYAFIVADGMGGHSCGEVASRAAVEYISNYILNESGSAFGKKGHEAELKKLVEDTNSAVYKKSMENAESNGMGTTLTMALISGSAMTVAHVGDSRLYMVRNGEMKQLTEDHSYIEELVKKGSLTRKEAENHPRKNIITRAIGCMPELKVDILSLTIEKDDIFVLCTDGLTNMLGEDMICEAVTDNNPDRACSLLVDAAREQGGEDNITVIVIKCE